MRNKKISYDSIVSFITILFAFLPVVASIIYVDVAKAGGNYYSGSGHDVAILLAMFASMFIGAFYVLMIVLSLINDFCNTNKKTHSVFAIIMTVLDILVALGTVGIILLFVFFPNL